MRESKFSEEQIVFIFRQAEGGVPAAELIRKYGISQQTLSRWRKKYGGLEAGELRRLKELEQENARLKTRAADLTLDKQMLLAESSFRYRSCKSRQEALRMRLRELAASRPRNRREPMRRDPTSLCLACVLLLAVGCAQEEKGTTATPQEAAHNAVPPSTCERLTDVVLDGVSIESAEALEARVREVAGPIPQTVRVDVPHCRVMGVIDSTIRFELLFPTTGMASS